MEISLQVVNLLAFNLIWPSTKVHVFHQFFIEIPNISQTSSSQFIDTPYLPALHLKTQKEYLAGEVNISVWRPSC